MGRGCPLPSAQRVFSVHSAPERGEKRRSLDLAESSCQLALSQAGPQSFNYFVGLALGRVHEVLAVNKPPSLSPGAAAPLLSKPCSSRGRFVARHGDILFSLPSSALVTVLPVAEFTFSAGEPHLRFP